MLNLVVHRVTTGLYGVKPDVMQINKAVKQRPIRRVTVNIFFCLLHVTRPPVITTSPGPAGLQFSQLRWKTRWMWTSELVKSWREGLKCGGQVTEQEVTPENWGEIASRIAFRRSLLERLHSSHLLSLTNTVPWLRRYFLLLFLFSGNCSRDAMSLTTFVDCLAGTGCLFRII